MALSECKELVAGRSPSPKCKELVPKSADLEGVSVLVRTSDGKDFTLPASTAFASAYIRNEFENGSPTKRIDLPKVNASTLEKIIEFLEFHAKKDLSEMHRKQFNEKYTRMDTGRLCELASSAHALDIKALIHLTCRAIARRIEGKNPDEIRETFNIQNDLSLEEQYAPIPFGLEDARVRLLNQLYAKKRRELEDSKRPQLTAPEPKDIQLRPVDEVLAFINDSKPAASADKEKKKKKSTGDKKKKDDAASSSGAGNGRESTSKLSYSTSSQPDGAEPSSSGGDAGEPGSSGTHSFEDASGISGDSHIASLGQTGEAADSGDPAIALVSLQQEVFSLRQRKAEIHAIVQQLEQEMKAVDARLNYLQDSTFNACLSLSSLFYGSNLQQAGSSTPAH